MPYQDMQHNITLVETKLLATPKEYYAYHNLQERTIFGKLTQAVADTFPMTVTKLLLVNVDGSISSHYTYRTERQAREDLENTLNQTFKQ